MDQTPFIHRLSWLRSNHHLLKLWPPWNSPYPKYSECQTHSLWDFFAIDFIIYISGTSNGSFDVVWITSSSLSLKIFDLESSPTSNKER